MGHDFDAGPRDSRHRSVLRRDDGGLALRCHRAHDHAGLRARPAVLGEARRGVSEIFGYRRFCAVRSRERILYFRQCHRQFQHAWLFLRSGFLRGRLEFRQNLRGRQQGPSARRQGWLLSGTAGRLAAGHPYRHVHGLRREGLEVRGPQHRAGTRGQGEINGAANPLTKKADEVQILKYALQNVAPGYGKTLTFMPKPIVGDNGSGMHVHQSLQKDGKALFAGDKYGGLSDIALYYIGGIIKHARAINAFTNASTNRYKRLVPGFEAPVKVAYSARNRSASIRIPWISNPKGRRIEVRFPDATANPYFAFAAMLLAGIDGIQNKIHPGDPGDKDLYDLEPEEDKKIPTVCHSLDQALEYLDKDRGFLKAGGVFTDDLIDAYIELKMKEVTRVRMTTHPIEVEMYYSL